jgi:uncharacterized protein (DUF2336 family)
MMHVHDMSEASITHPNLPVDTMRWVIQSGAQTNEVVWVAENPACTPGLLEQLVGTGRVDVIKAVARHPNCPTAVLGRLAEHEDDGVVTNVAHNPNTAPATLVRIARSNNWEAQYGVSTNPAAPAEALVILMSDPELRDRILEHPNLPEEYRTLGQAVR